MNAPLKQRRINFGGQKKAKTTGNREEDVDEETHKVRPHRVRSRSLSNNKRRPIPNPSAFLSSEKKRNPNSGTGYLNAPNTPMKRSSSDELQTQFERAQAELDKRFTNIISIAETKTSIIFRAVERNINTTCVVKHLNDRFVRTSERQKSALLEYHNAVSLKAHPNVVRYEWYLQSGPFIYFQMEYCSLGSLETYLQSNKLYDDSANQEKEIVWNFFLDILLGLIWIHKNGLVHLDIKPANIFLVPSHASAIPRLKIGDFGLSRKKGNYQRSKFEKVKKGDGRYLAPELLEKVKNISETVDIYSLGITIYEMALDYTASTALWEEIRRGEFSTEKVSPSLSRILRRMLCVQQDLRPTAIAILFTSEKLVSKAGELGIPVSGLDLGTDVVADLGDDKINVEEKMADVDKCASASENSDGDVGDVDVDVEEVDMNAEDGDSEDTPTPNENSNPNKQSFDSVKKKLVFYQD